MPEKGVNTTYHLPSLYSRSFNKFALLNHTVGTDIEIFVRSDSLHILAIKMDKLCNFALSENSYRTNYCNNTILYISVIFSTNKNRPTNI